MIDYTKFNSFASIDPGFGDVKTAMFKEDGTIMVSKFPSAVARVNPRSVFGAGNAVLFEGDYYLVGEEALNFKPIEMNDYETLEKYSPLFVHHVFTKYGRFSNIVVGLSIAQSHNSGSFQDRLSSFEINGETFALDVQMLPQGIGAKVVIQKQFGDMQNYLIVDGGFGTVDLVPSFDGQSPMHAIQAIENRGVVMMCNELIDYISTNYDIELSPKEAKQALDQGTIKIYGEPIELDEQISKISTDYTRNLIQQIKRKFKDSWHKFDAVIFVGGLAYYIDTEVEPHLKIVDKAEYFNAVGGLRWANEKENGGVSKTAINQAKATVTGRKLPNKL